ncbi:MAG TPA: MAPEG family protein [Kofleriaceae bacterium]|nr:MAPEG family protein [Kofleriaceae bacterium]
MLHVPYIAIIAAFALIYLPRQVVTLEMKKQAGGYNNNDPRTQQARLEGLGKRALAAHMNAFEAFAPFAAGVLVAMQRRVDIDAVAYISLGFVAVRTIYMIAYLTDKATLRSGMWTLGMGAITALLVLAAIG